MFQTIESELKARVFLHKVAITKALIVNTYVKQEKANGVIIPDTCLVEQAEQKADIEMARIMQQGKLDIAYNEAWESIADIMPDNYSIM